MQTTDPKSSSSIPLVQLTNHQQSTNKTRCTPISIRNNSPQLYSHSHLNIQQTTLKSYQRHCNTSIHETALRCLEESAFLKRKSWIKQVQFSEYMVKATNQINSSFHTHFLKKHSFLFFK